MTVVRMMMMDRRDGMEPIKVRFRWPLVWPTSTRWATKMGGRVSETRVAPKVSRAYALARCEWWWAVAGKITATPC